MAKTHSYLSAIVPSRDVDSFTYRQVAVRVKARTFSADTCGWVGQPIFRTVIPSGTLTGPQIINIRRFLQEESVEMAEDVDEGTYELFAALCVLITDAHGEKFPTWVGDLYIQPVFTRRGSSRKRSLSHYLVTEAPGLDCGQWEEDPLPSRGG